MGTSNFTRMKDFPLYCRIGADCDENGDELLDLDFKMLNEDLETGNEKLKILKMSVLPGYYEGFQLFAEERGTWYDSDLEGENEAVVLEREKAYIRDYFKRVAMDFGLLELKIVGTFSNGETIYEKVGK